MTSNDTLIVPATPSGFNDVFMAKKQFYAVRISERMLPHIRYLAVYQSKPISAITHYVKVAKIEKFLRTDKYILYFDEEPVKVGPIKLDPFYKALAPQTPRYSSISRLLSSKYLTEILTPPTNGWKRSKNYSSPH